MNLSLRNSLKVLLRELATILVLGVCAFAGLWLIRRLPDAFAAPPVSLGSTVTGVQLSRHPSLVLVASSECKYSRLNTAFHRRLTQVAVDSGINFVAVVNDERAAVSYADLLRVRTTEIKVRRAKSIGLRGTPTIILTDRTGRVRALWEGHMSSYQQDAILAQVGRQNHTIARLKANGVPTKSVELTESELERALSAYMLIDLQQRERYQRYHRFASTNIPFDEITIRGPVEMPLDKPLLIDCSVSDIGECILASDALIRKGFEVDVLDPGARGTSCAMRRE